ncbi:hypothetical protein J3D47_004852 [Pseudomonas laurylsulfativorans]|nr:hypothetical protein [Pseudomonas laurylsulfativorans]
MTLPPTDQQSAWAVGHDSPVLAYDPISLEWGKVSSETLTKPRQALSQA